MVPISKGVCLKANRTRFGVSYPPVEEIVSQIAKRDKAKIRPTGETAANLIGLSEQITMRTCFLTSGTARELNIDGRTVVLKRAAPKAKNITSIAENSLFKGSFIYGKDSLSFDELLSSIAFIQEQFRKCVILKGWCEEL